MEAVTVGFQNALQSECFSSVYHIRLLSLLPLPYLMDGSGPLLQSNFDVHAQLHVNPGVNNRDFFIPSMS